jgi:hypothetical protein
MTTQGKATFQVTGWDEKPYEQKNGTPKLTQAHVTNTFSGDIEGDGTAEYLMVYPTDEQATFVGLQRVSGSVGGQRGTFVLEVRGTFAGGIAKGDWSVVPDSGTGKLTGLTGNGGYESKSDGSADVKLNYNL